jgi:hypothetical protein
MPNSVSSLAPHAREVDALLAEGVSNRQIAARFGVGESSVRRYKASGGIGTYVPSSERLRSVLIVPDLHAPYHDEDAWQLMMEVARDLKPETIVVIGDFADFYAVSSHSKDPARAAQLGEELNVVKAKRAELDALGATTKIFCEGNHCHRLQRYLRDKAPELFGLVDIPGLLGLDDSWEFVEYRNHTRRGAVHYTHDTGHAGRNAAFRSLDTYQHSVVTGHTHRLVYVVEGNAVGQPKLSAQFGWLGDVNEIEYLHRAKAKKDWALAFGVGYEDVQTGHTFLVPVPILEYRCVFNGKLYKAPLNGRLSRLRVPYVQAPSEAPGYKQARRARKQEEIRRDPEAYAKQLAASRERTQKYRDRHREELKARDREKYKVLTLDPEWRARQNRGSRDSRRRNPKVLRVLEERSKPCVDCGACLPPEVMDLDHVRGEKSFTLASGVVARSSVTAEMVESEIAKCEVRCPTCHRLRHWREYCERLGEEAA